MRLFVWFLMLLVLKVKSFRMLGSDKSQRMMLNMRWSFTSATHSPGDQINNFCGSDGAFYYQPAVKAKFYGKQRLSYPLIIIGIFVNGIITTGISYLIANAV